MALSSTTLRRVIVLLLTSLLAENLGLDSTENPQVSVKTYHLNELGIMLSLLTIGASEVYMHGLASGRDLGSTMGSYMDPQCGSLAVYSNSES
ncbi:hypothetical protein VNO77_44630 [Canavalia gladiata]|uniref:Uncharacterized protein n=1 Tax=Canavalia gladiata TaxID=3824 RepID=A0AAN9PR76_CANGL